MTFEYLVHITGVGFENLVTLSGPLLESGIPKEKIFLHEINYGSGPAVTRGPVSHRTGEPGRSFYGPSAGNIRYHCPAHPALLAHKGFPAWTAREFAAGIHYPEKDL